jgi:hypothetical protein
MELWQMDLMNGVRLESGAELSIVTGVDDHSRFCVCAHLTSRATARPVCEALLEALERHGAPEQILTDNGKVFTGRFGRGSGPVLFDRICREHGIRHLLTAPRSPTTTGKVERFHETLRKEFLRGCTFASQKDAQAALDAWVQGYNAERPHQSIGDVPPHRRFELARREPQDSSRPPAAGAAAGACVTRLVGRTGKISLCGFEYRVGAYLAGETVTVELTAHGLLQVSSRGVLVGSFARRHSVRTSPARERLPRARQAQPATGAPSVQRLVDPYGFVSFAGTGYWVGTPHRGKQVEVRLAGDAVEIRDAEVLLRAQPARHDQSKEHGAFSTPNGRPHRKNTPRHCDAAGGTEVLEPKWNTGGEP